MKKTYLLFAKALKFSLGIRETFNELIEYLKVKGFFFTQFFSNSEHRYLINKFYLVSYYNIIDESKLLSKDILKISIIIFDFGAC